MENNNKELTIARTFSASRQFVWNAWTDPKLLTQWWGPRGVTTPVCEMDARPGGAIHIVMLAGKELGRFAGNEWPMTGVVKGVVAPEKLVFVSSPIMDGKAIMDTLTTVAFKESAGKTEMTLHIVVTRMTPEAEGPLAGMEMGWTQSIDKLGELLAKGH